MKRFGFAVLIAVLGPLSCGDDDGSDNSNNGDNSGQAAAVCDGATAYGMCTEYNAASTAASTACAGTSGGVYKANADCPSANSVGTCTCSDLGAGQGGGVIFLYSPTSTCASAKTAYASSCNGAAGTFSGGC